MNIELEDAIKLIKTSISQMESLQNELKDTRSALDIKSRRLEVEVAKNTQLSEELERLHAKVAQLLDNSVTEVMTPRANIPSKIINSPPEKKTSEILTDNTIQTPTLNSTSYYVTKATLLREVELPHFLIDIGKLTLETFGSNVSISQVLEINDRDRKKFPVPVGITLPGLKSHLKKRIKQRSPLKLETSETIKSTCPRQDTDSIVSVNKALSTSSSLNDNATQYDSLLGPKAQYTTRKGKVLNGWLIDILPKEELKKIDPYTFKVDGRFFVRECYGDVLLNAIRSFMCTSQDTVHAGQEDSSSILKLLDEEFLFSNIRMASESVLFEFDEYTSNKILINTAHPYLQQASSLSNDFWKSIRTFMVLWRLLKKMNLQNEAKEKISLARTQLMRTLTMYVEKKNIPIYKMCSLPSNVLFDVSSFSSGLLVHVNENHPFNEYYLMTLEQHEKETFFQIYAAWLHAEKETLSNSTEVALKVTRQLIGTEFYHLVDEIRHGSDLF